MWTEQWKWEYPYDYQYPYPYEPKIPTKWGEDWVLYYKSLDMKRFTHSKDGNGITVIGNLPGFAKTSVKVYFENGKLFIKCDNYSYSVDCLATEYDWNKVKTSFYEGLLNVFVPYVPKNTNRKDVTL